MLTLSCPDRPGIVHAVTGVLVDLDCNILESQQFGDPATGRFFLRLEATGGAPALERVADRMAPVGGRFAMSWRLHDASARCRILILVSREGHCLNDLLFRQRSGALRAEIVGVVSNHPDLAPLCDAAGVPFSHLPVSPETRPEQEGEMLRIVDERRAELVVLARYMRVLSPATCERLRGRVINIHHSFLPSFPGSRPYVQAHERGVKVIGATAHYVTADLDEGPIIEQDVERVDHTMDPAQLAAAGRDVECTTLARAVRWHAEHRVLLNGSRTVVFR
ncbi:MAG TPA: formyltetrahydrofolate deformylase [Candidatus Dormibacteraeota bacterium]|nr:formyltetrahydrofolate deformylase [Candidatus Dormibacteraeota bacterium]